MSWTCKNNRNLSIKDATDRILKRSANRERYYGLAVKLLAVAKMNELRLIMENPWSMQHFLKNGFVVPPTIIDKNRMVRGDFFVKPTAYWFINCEPTNGYTFQHDKKQKSIIHSKPGSEAGVCSESRSMISPDYARNFICDFILGKVQYGTQPQIFE